MPALKTAPSILASDFSRLGEEIEAVVHIRSDHATAVAVVVCVEDVLRVVPASPDLAGEVEFAVRILVG